MEELWCYDPKVLLKNNTSFWPSQNKTEKENMNALTRFLLYATALLFIYGGNSNVLLISLVTLSVLCVALMKQYKRTTTPKLIRNSQEKPEGCTNNQNLANFDKIRNINYDENGCQGPTKDNPMSNYMYAGGSSPFKWRACPIEQVEEQVYDILSDGFDYNQHDIFNTKAHNRQFFSNPVTQAYNDQTQFAKSLYTPNVDRTIKM